MPTPVIAELFTTCIDVVALAIYFCTLYDASVNSDLYKYHWVKKAIVLPLMSFIAIVIAFSDMPNIHLTGYFSIWTVVSVKLILLAILVSIIFMLQYSNSTKEPCC